MSDLGDVGVVVPINVDDVGVADVVHYTHPQSYVPISGERGILGGTGSNVFIPIDTSALRFYRSSYSYTTPTMKYPAIAIDIDNVTVFPNSSNLYEPFSCVLYKLAEVTDQPLHKDTPMSVRMRPNYQPTYGVLCGHAFAPFYSAPVDTTVDLTTETPIKFRTNWAVNFEFYTSIETIDDVDYESYYIELTSLGSKPVLYSITGSEPTTVYSGPIEITGTTSIKFVVDGSPYDEVHEETVTFAGANPPADYDILLHEYWIEPYLYMQRGDFMFSMTMSYANGRVTLVSEKGFDILYSVDGTYPTVDYVEPFEITAVTTVKFICVRPDPDVSGYSDSRPDVGALPAFAGRKKSFSVNEVKINHELPPFTVSCPVMWWSFDGNDTSTTLGDDDYAGFQYRFLAGSATHAEPATIANPVATGTKLDYNFISGETGSVTTYKYGVPSTFNDFYSQFSSDGVRIGMVALEYVYDEDTEIGALSMSCPNSVNFRIDYKTDLDDPWVEYTGPVNVTEDVTFYIKGVALTSPPYHISSDVFEREVELVESFTDYLYTNTSIDVTEKGMVHLHRDADYYISPTGTGNGLTPESPANWETLLGVTDDGGVITDVDTTLNVSLVVWATEGVYTHIPEDLEDVEYFYVPAGVEVRGGYNATFTKRDVANQQSILRSSGLVSGSICHGSGELDGFHADLLVTRADVYTGISTIGVSTIRNCTINMIGDIGCKNDYPQPFFYPAGGTMINCVLNADIMFVPSAADDEYTPGVVYAIFWLYGTWIESTINIKLDSEDMSVVPDAPLNNHDNSVDLVVHANIFMSTVNANVHSGAGATSEANYNTNISGTSTFTSYGYTFTYNLYSYTTSYVPVSGSSTAVVNFHTGYYYKSIFNVNVSASDGRPGRIVGGISYAYVYDGDPYETGYGCAFTLCTINIEAVSGNGGEGTGPYYTSTYIPYRTYYTYTTSGTFTNTIGGYREMIRGGDSYARINLARALGANYGQYDHNYDPPEGDPGFVTLRHGNYVNLTAFAGDEGNGGTRPDSHFSGYISLITVSSGTFNQFNLSATGVHDDAGYISFLEPTYTSEEGPIINVEDDVEYEESPAYAFVGSETGAPWRVDGLFPWFSGDATGRVGSSNHGYLRAGDGVPIAGYETPGSGYYDADLGITTPDGKQRGKFWDY